MSTAVADHDACPCTCGAPVMWGLNKWGHAARTCGHKEWGAERGCVTKACIVRRNNKKGRSAHVEMHRELRTEDMPLLPHKDEEKGQTYPVEVLYVRPESKAGKQIPVNFISFITGEWFRHALRQSELGVPVGSGARPAVYVNAGRKGKFLIIPIKPKGRARGNTGLGGGGRGRRVR